MENGLIEEHLHCIAVKWPLIYLVFPILPSPPPLTYKIGLHKVRGNLNLST
jgi:hypothetical protein